MKVKIGTTYIIRYSVWQRNYLKIDSKYKEYYYWGSYSFLGNGQFSKEGPSKYDLLRKATAIESLFYNLS